MDISGLHGLFMFIVSLAQPSNSKIIIRMCFSLLRGRSDLFGRSQRQVITLQK